jgi:hypothetical protein
MREVEELDRHRDPRDLAGEPGNRLPEEEAPERWRFAERAEVDRDPLDEPEPSGPVDAGALFVGELPLVCQKS